MNNFLAFLHQAGPFTVIPVLLACLYKWQHLPLPFRLYFTGAVFVAIIALARAFFGPSNSWFYVSAFFGVTLFGFLFQTVLAKQIDTRIIWVFVAVIWAIIGWYVLQNGVKKFQLWVIIPYDLFMITFCMTYVVYYLKQPKPMDISVFYLILYLLMEFFVNLFLDIMSNFLKSYFSDSFMTLLWKQILPVYNLLRLSIFLWIILTVKPKLPSLANMPSFNT